MLGEGQSCITPANKLSYINIQGALAPCAQGPLCQRTATGVTQRISTSHTHLSVWPVPQPQSGLPLSGLQQPGAPLKAQKGQATSKELIF